MATDSGEGVLSQALCHVKNAPVPVKRTGSSTGQSNAATASASQAASMQTQ
ncbi:MAG: hypothetical protein JXO44_14140 [Clostridia bacterium]|nr:hypothetical protein [Clostridia bacterium]